MCDHYGITFLIFILFCVWPLKTATKKYVINQPVVFFFLDLHFSVFSGTPNPESWLQHLCLIDR